MNLSLTNKDDIMNKKEFHGRGKVAIVRTSPKTVLDDYARLMDLAEYKRVLPAQNKTLLKINISWFLCRFLGAK
jgi:hypothetical protein